MTDQDLDLDRQDIPALNEEVRRLEKALDVQRKVAQGFKDALRDAYRPHVEQNRAYGIALEAAEAEVRRLTREYAELKEQFDTIASELDRRDKAPKTVSAHQVWVAAKSQADFHADGANVDAYIEPLIEGLQKAGITVDTEEFAAYVGDTPVASWTEQQRTIERVQEALAGHPECDKYDDDDAITCGWKSAVRSIQWALNEEDGE